MYKSYDRNFPTLLEKDPSTHNDTAFAIATTLTTTTTNANPPDQL